MAFPAFPVLNNTAPWIDFLFFPSPYAPDRFDWHGIAVETTAQYTWLWAPLVIAYLPVVWSLERYMSRRPEVDVHYLYPLWNLALGVFSLLGAIHIVPLLVRQVTQGAYTDAAGQTHSGWHRSVCNGELLYHTNGYWIWWFNMSKLPEFIDTILLRLRKRPVIFLHWFHHIVTAAFCLYSNQAHFRGFGGPSGGRVIWFAAMNLTVHAVMYTYYFLAAVGMGKTLEKFGINIVLTSMQLLQMAMGLLVLQHSTTCENLHWDPEHPYSSNFGYWTGMAMYAAYFALFANLFGAKYLWPAPKAAPAPPASLSDGNVQPGPQDTTNGSNGTAAELRIAATQNGSRSSKRVPQASPVHAN